jgi:hypothetical protein
VLREPLLNAGAQGAPLPARRPAAALAG